MPNHTCYYVSGTQHLFYPTLILGHTIHMQSAENPDLKVLGRQGLVIE